MAKRSLLALILCAILVCSCLVIVGCIPDTPSGNQGQTGNGDGGGSTVPDEEYYIVDVQMVTPPTKNDYGEGDVFDPKGMVLKVIWNDGWEQLVEDGRNCIFSPSGPITSDTEQITATYDDKTFTLPVTVNKIAGIELVSYPARNMYVEGEAFSPVGLTVVTKLENGEVGKVLTDYTLSENAKELSPEDDKVTVSYERAGNVYTVDVPVIVFDKDAVIVTEAEAGTVVGGEKVTQSSILKYASGNSFVRNLKEGGSITIIINAAKDTKASIRFVASSYEDALDEQGDKLDYTMPLQINEIVTVSLNGVEIQISDDEILPGGYDDERGSLSRFCHWYEIALDNVDLHEGENTFVITSKVNMNLQDNKDTPDVNEADLHSTLFDCLRVFYADLDAVPKAEEPPVVDPDGETLTEKVYQAESTTLSGITTVVKSKGDLSGLFNVWKEAGDTNPGFIKNFTANSTITIKITLKEAIKARLSIYGSSTLGSDVTAASLIKGVTLNGTAVTANSGVCFPKNDKSVAAMATFNEYILGEFDLVKGENIIVITFNATESCFIDRLVLKDAALAACTHENKTAVGEAKDATCTAEGLTAGVKCADCGKVLEEQKATAKVEHTAAEAVKKNEVKPTCTEAGSYDMIVYCSVCKTYEISKTSHTVQPTGHSYTDDYDASCNNEGCDYERVINCDHTYDGGVITTRPTPSSEGVKTFTCTKCGNTYTEAVAKVIEAIYEIEKGAINGGESVSKSGLLKFMSGNGFVRNLTKGGTITITVVMDEATVGSFRLVMSSHEDNGGKNASTSPIVINEAITVTINGVKYEIGANEILPGGPDYDFDGNGSVDSLTKHCHFYELVFNDVELKKGENTFVITSLVEMGGFDYAADLHSTIFDVLKVWYKDVPHVHTEQTVKGKAATCTEAGLTDGVKCADCGEILTAQQEIKALGHDRVSHDAKAPTCTAVGWNAYETCTRCDYTTYSELPTVAHSYDDDYDATCNNCDFVRDAACRHDNKTAIGEAKAATCTLDGITAGQKCADCGEVIEAQKTIEKLGHDMMTDAAKAPTCTDTGLTEGSHCSRCDGATTAQQTVAALGHSYDGGIVTTKPTTEAEGVKTFTCTRCQGTRTEAIQKLLEVRFEAEGGTVVNGAKTTTGTVINYASGKAFVANLKKDGTITITIPSEIDTVANLIFVMSSYEDALDASGNKLTSTMALKINEYLTFSINGQMITVGDDAILPGGADDERGKNSRFAHWYELVIEDVQLKAGENTFVITSLVDMSNDNKDDLHSTIFDVLKVQYTDSKAIPKLTETKLEAENVHSGFTTAGTHGTASSGQSKHFSNGTFIKDATANSTITIRVTSSEKCKVKLTMTAVSTSNANVTEGALLKNIAVNGSVITNYNSSTKVCLKANGGAFSADRHTTYEFGEYELSVGENVIVITFNASGAAFIDYFTVIPVED